MGVKTRAVLLAAAATSSVVMFSEPWLTRQKGADGPYAVPEIDVSAGVATLALVVCIGLLFYNRAIIDRQGPG